jgi:hypothetical protein
MQPNRGKFFAILLALVLGGAASAQTHDPGQGDILRGSGKEEDILLTVTPAPPRKL